MNQKNQLEIITQYGWRKDYTLAKGIIYIGSATTNDIVLDEPFGGGVAPLQVQLITVPGGNSLYKLINVAETAIAIGVEPENILAPRSALDLTDGLQFKLGEFTLVYHSSSQADTDAMRNSPSVGLRLELPNTQLAPNQSLEGLVTVSNLGQRTGARFDLTLTGLDPDCYDLAPGPLLSSGAEKAVLFRLHHRGHKPLAGPRRIIIRATARDTYPGEQATVSQMIQVLPFYQHRLTLAPARGITPDRPGKNVPGALPPAETETMPRPKTDTAWDLPLAAGLAPRLKFKAGELPRRNNNAAQSHPHQSTAAAEDWWPEPPETISTSQLQVVPSAETNVSWSATRAGVEPVVKQNFPNGTKIGPAKTVRVEAPAEPPLI